MKVWMKPFLNESVFYLLLHRPPCGRVDPTIEVGGPFRSFLAREWIQLLNAARDEKAVLGRIWQRRRRGGDDVECRVMRAEKLVHVGELSSARQALEGSEVAPGTRATLDLIARQTAPKSPPTRGTPARDRGAPTSFSFRSGREDVWGGTSDPHEEDRRA